MPWTPRLNITCGRCGKPRGLRHVCVSSRNRKATVKAGVSFGKCPKCRKRITNPLTHDCRPPTDYKRRRRAADQQRRAEERNQKQSLAKVKRSRQQGPAKPKHDYQSCMDGDCQRALCVAYKTGYKAGHHAGYEQGFTYGYDSGYARGFPDGIKACPLRHE